MSKDIHFSRERMRGALVGPGQPRHWLARSSPPRYCHNAVIWVENNTKAARCSLPKPLQAPVSPAAMPNGSRGQAGEVGFACSRIKGVNMHKAESEH